jgi:molybdopterin/thiamine biosynthesis adenylyltransferase
LQAARSRNREDMCYDITMTPRYSRQVLFRGIGAAGQEKLSSSRVLLVGCGALGSVIAEILVRAGIGELTIADRDFVEETNLQRQSLFTEADAAEALPKAIAASRHLAEINSSVRVVPNVVEVSSRTIEKLVASQDLVVDGTDNFETRYLLNDASLYWNIPWIYGACVGAYGIALAIIPGQTPCLRCLLAHLPPPGSSPTCDTIGVIGPIVHAVAALESAEALKILTGNGDRVHRKLVSMDLWENQIMAVDLGRIGRAQDCPACVGRKFEFLSGDHEAQSEALCGRDAVQIRPGVAVGELEFASIARRLASVGSVVQNEYLLRATVEGHEIAMFRDGRSIIRGTSDPAEARRIYSKIIGN